MLERLGLVAIIIGLAVLFYVVLDYEYVDGFYVEEDERAYYEGVILGKRFNPDSGWLYVEVEACRKVGVFYEDNISKGVGDDVLVKGNFRDGVLSASEIR